MSKNIANKLKLLNKSFEIPTLAKYFSNLSGMQTATPIKDLSDLSHKSSFYVI